MKLIDRCAVERFATVLVAALPFLLRATTSVAFVTFESGQVRPLALSPDGSRLFAVDTPDDRLELFAVDATSGNLTHTATVPVDLEPVAIAARTNTEVWAVNHLSDSVSIVDLSGPQPRGDLHAGINTGNNGTPGPFTSQSDQVRGFGVLHDGSVETLFRFHNAVVFNVGFGTGSAANTLRRQVEQFVLAFDSDLAPIVGQQVTLTSTNATVAGPRVDLLNQRAAAGECDLTVKGVIKNPITSVPEQRGALRLASGQFPDRPGVRSAAQRRPAPRLRRDGRAGAHLHLRAAGRRRARRHRPRPSRLRKSAP
jgi:hypothetical protein